MLTYRNTTIAIKARMNDLQSLKMIDLAKDDKNQVITSKKRFKSRCENQEKLII